MADETITSITIDDYGQGYTEGEVTIIQGSNRTATGSITIQGENNGIHTIAINLGGKGYDKTKSVIIEQATYKIIAVTDILDAGPYIFEGSILTGTPLETNQSPQPIWHRLEPQEESIDFKTLLFYESPIVPSTTNKNWTTIGRSNFFIDSADSLTDSLTDSHTDMIKCKVDATDAWSSVNDLTPYQQPGQLYDQYLPGYGCLPMSGGRMVWNELNYDANGRQPEDTSTNIPTRVYHYLNTLLSGSITELTKKEYKCTSYTLSSGFTDSNDLLLNSENDQYFSLTKGKTCTVNVKTITFTSTTPGVTFSSYFVIADNTKQTKQNFTVSTTGINGTDISKLNNNSGLITFSVNSIPVNSTISIAIKNKLDVDNYLIITLNTDTGVFTNITNSVTLLGSETMYATLPYIEGLNDNILKNLSITGYFPELSIKEQFGLYINRQFFNEFLQSILPGEGTYLNTIMNPFDTVVGNVSFTKSNNYVINPDGSGTFQFNFYDTNTPNTLNKTTSTTGTSLSRDEFIVKPATVYNSALGFTTKGALNPSSSFSITPGTGYSVTTTPVTLTPNVGSSGSGAKANITKVLNGGIDGYTITSIGENFAIGDTLTFPGGTGGVITIGNDNLFQGDLTNSVSYIKPQSVTTPKSLINDIYVLPVSTQTVFTKIGGIRYFFSQDYELSKEGKNNGAMVYDPISPNPYPFSMPNQEITSDADSIVIKNRIPTNVYLSMAYPGVGYKVSRSIPLSGEGTDASVNILSVIALQIIIKKTGPGGSITSWDISTTIPGKGYTVGEVLSITGGNGDATLTITSLGNSSTGQLSTSKTSYTLNPGTGYISSQNNITDVIIEDDNSNAIGAIYKYQVIDYGSGFTTVNSSLVFSQSENTAAISMAGGINTVISGDLTITFTPSTALDATAVSKLENVEYMMLYNNVVPIRAIKGTITPVTLGDTTINFTPINSVDVNTVISYTTDFFLTNEALLTQNYDESLLLDVRTEINFLSLFQLQDTIEGPYPSNIQIALNDIKNFLSNLSEGDTIALEQEFIDQIDPYRVHPIYTFSVTNVDPANYTVSILSLNVSVNGKSQSLTLDRIPIESPYTYVYLYSTRVATNGSTRKGISVSDMAFIEGIVKYNGVVFGVASIESTTSAAVLDFDDSEYHNISSFTDNSVGILTNGTQSSEVSVTSTSKTITLTLSPGDTITVTSQDATISNTSTSLSGTISTETTSSTVTFTVGDIVDNISSFDTGSATITYGVDSVSGTVTALSKMTVKLQSII